MAADLQFLDMTASSSTPAGFFVPVPISRGPSWQPNDIRVLWQLWSDQTQSPGSTACDVVWLNPPGYSTVNTLLNWPGPGSGQATADRPGYRWGVSWRRLQPGDTDTFISYARPDLFDLFGTALFTVRGVDPSFTPTPAMLNFDGPNVDHLPHLAGTAVVSSVSVPAPGAVVVCLSTVPNYTLFIQPGSSSFTTKGTGAALGIPPGWSNMVSTDKSGFTYTPSDHAPATIVVAKSFSSSGSTGAVNFPFATCIDPKFHGATMFFRAAPDVSATAGSCSAVPTSAAATGGATNVVVASAGNATAVATSKTAFNPMQGYWISDPLTLPGDPVTGSVIRWASSTPTGSTVTVETSINNGASWDVATNNRLVSRLKPGDTVTRGVLVRISLTRTLATDPAPTVSYLEMQVSTDSGSDELVPIGHGMIDKVTTKTVGGSTGAGSTVSSVGSAAVTSKGGGQTGGGTSIKIHVTDMSRAIKRNVWQMPYVVPAGINYGDAVRAMVLDRLPSQTEFAISTTTRTTDSALVYGMEQGGDPWQDIREVAMAIGFEAYFDPRGVFVFRAVPDPRIGEPVFVFDENFNPIVAEATKELSDEQTFNDVVVTGQSSGTQNPVSAEAFDNDPASRTYILGDYGRVGQRLPFNNVTTQDQAQDAANAVLNNSLGAAETVTIVNVPHPALEPGDVVKIKVSNVKIDGTYIINSMTTPMSPAEAQQLVCFRQSTNA